MWNIELLNHEIYFIFYCFIILSFFGWVWETTKKSMETHTFVNRGFLAGPILPIYGFGGTIVYLLLFPIKSQLILVFLFGAIIATVLEYITAVVMETAFHAKWWDYSEYRFNFQGRISLIASLFWGVLSVIDLYVFLPIIQWIIGLIPRRAGEIAGTIIFLMISADSIVTVVCALQLSKIVDSLLELREELVSYLENSGFMEKTSELKEYVRNHSMSNLREKYINISNELTAKFQLRLNKETIDEEERTRRVVKFREELDSKIKNFTIKYRQSTEKGNLVHKRLLKAFPDIKLMHKGNILEDLKEKWYQRKKRDE